CASTAAGKKAVVAIRGSRNASARADRRLHLAGTRYRQVEKLLDIPIGFDEAFHGILTFSDLQYVRKKSQICAFLRGRHPDGRKRARVFFSARVSGSPERAGVARLGWE